MTQQKSHDSWCRAIPDAPEDWKECPYCYNYLAEKVDELTKRVAELEKPPVKKAPKRRGAYDLGARGPGCPHRPKYRHCWCK